MSKHLNIKRSVSLSLICSLITILCAVSVQAGPKAEAVCYPAGSGYVYCDYGMDMTKKNLTGVAEAKTDNKWAGYREIYLGGTWTDEAYNYDGLLIDKFTFELRTKSNANSPLSCEADLYIEDGKAKYCTFQINQYCDVLALAEDWESLVLDDEKLTLFVQFGEEFIENSKSMLTDLMGETEAVQQGCDCGAEYQLMSDSEIIEELVTQLLDMYSEGLLDDFGQEEFDQIIEGLLESYELCALAESQPEEIAQAQGENSGAEVLEIKHNVAICRIIGEDVATGRLITSCFWGHRIDASRDKAHEYDVDNVRILAKEELYFGGTYLPDENGDGYPDYQYDGEFIGRFRKNCPGL